VLFSAIRSPSARKETEIMRLSELLVKTERQVAASAELASHQLLLRAGLAGDATPGTGR
jgi:hypothetical protein